MAFKIFSAKDFGRVLKATIQSSGRLGFSGETARVMKIDTETFFLIGEDDSVQADLILVKIAEANPDAFKAKKSSDYYYLETTALFDMLGYDYKLNGNIFFDVTRYPSLDNDAGGEVYIMKKRDSKNRKPKSDQTSKDKETNLFDHLEQ